MTEQRKEIIIKEIAFWKQNNMLPEEYCNYLLALYTGGSGDLLEHKRKGLVKMAVPGISVVAATALCSVVYYFTELSFILQMALVMLVFIGGFSAFIFLFKKELFSHSFLLLSAFALLLGSVEITSRISHNKPMVLFLILALNCFIWALTGWKLKLLYFSISGVAGILLIIIFYIFK